MGSTYTTMPGKTIKGFAGKEYPIPMYLQFVPGVVVDVVHSTESFRYNGENSINTIIAKPHITDKLSKRKATLGEKERYYPLFRIHSDVPTKGDPVLLCTVGKINYYLGPLNTSENNPTWNDDPSFVSEIQFDSLSNAQSLRAKKGQTENFNKEVLYTRLTKKRKKELDYGNALSETTGDTIFEGRHGNSIRIGSRSNNPYVFISNGRAPINSVESINDGGLISITSNGSIQQHLAGGVDIDENGTTSNVIFKLASDTVEGNNYPIGDIYTSVNGFDDDSFIYNDSVKNQMLLHSGRIFLNSKLDDVYISSKNDTHIGSGRYTTISSGESIIVNTPDFNIGDPFNFDNDMQPMVLGDALKEVLTEIINLIPTITIPTMLGPQVPTPDIQAKITQITTLIDNITSTKHKIEQG